MSNIPFTSGQYWVLEELQGVQPRYINSFLFIPLPDYLNVQQVQSALLHVINHHDALRFRLHQQDGMYQQYVLAEERDCTVTWVKLFESSEAEHGQLIERASIEMQQSLNTLDGSLLRCAYLDRGSNTPGFLVVILNHIITDGFSGQIMTQDILLACQQLKSRNPIQLPPTSSSFTTWCQTLDTYRNSHTVKNEIETYWLQRPWHTLARIPIDFPKAVTIDPQTGLMGYGTEASEQSLDTVLTLQETRALLNYGVKHALRIEELVVAAMALAYHQWTSSTAFYLFLQNNGRQTIFDHIDLSRTVGYMAHSKRQFLELPTTTDLEPAVQHVIQYLRATTQQGHILEWVARGGKQLPIAQAIKHIPMADVCFIYHGRISHSTTEHPYETYLQALPSPAGLRNHPLNCTGGIVHDQLLLRWEYSDLLFKHTTIEHYTNLVSQLLKTLARSTNIVKTMKGKLL